MTRRTLRIAGALLLAHVAAGNALACSPPPTDIFASTEKRVRERYALAESIELVTVVDVKPITTTDTRGKPLLKGERVAFRIDKVFKGKSRPGGKMIVESIGMCVYSVSGNGALKNDWSIDGGIEIPSRTWLLYRPANSHVEMGASDLARPISDVGFDLPMLERWRKTQRK